LNGLSNTAQAALVIIAYVLGAIGLLTAAIPSQIPEPLKSYIALAFLIVGAIAYGVKEALGIQPTSTPAAAQAAASKTTIYTPRIFTSKKRLMFLAFLK
jgi:hypothetical protein